MKRYGITCFLVLLSGALLAATALGVTFIWDDGDFPEDDWDIIPWYPPQDSGDSDATLAFTIGHGGNPDALRAMGQTLGGGPDDGAMTVQLNNQWTWDPSVEGEVIEIDGGFDFQWSTGGAARIALAVQQDGEIFLHVLNPQADDTSWTTYYHSILTADDFEPIDPAETGQPDFSETGSLLTFGIATGQLASVAGGETSFYQYVDNVLLVMSVGGLSAVGASQQALLQAPTVHPNPFNPRTEISFEIPAAGFASLRIFDLAGRQVRTLEARPFVPGHHAVIWQGDSDTGRSMPSGIYLVVLQTRQGMVSQRLTLTR